MNWSGVCVSGVLHLVLSSCSKYRVLDDCSRLRDIIKALPERRHFVPSLLLFVWVADEPKSASDLALLPGDFLDMVGASW